jgi:hypothetical protein
MGLHLMTPTHTRNVVTKTSTPNSITISTAKPTVVAVTKTHDLSVGIVKEAPRSTTFSSKTAVVPPKPKVEELPAKQVLKEVVQISKHVDKTPVVKQLDRVAYHKAAPQVGTINGPLTSAASLVSISQGSRLPNLGVFAISLDSSFIDFHGVLPRVVDHVPMSPLRFLFEKKGGVVDWNNPTKTVSAKVAGNDLLLQIGNDYALLNKGNVKLERPSFLDRGRTIIPLSLAEKSLNVKIDYDRSTNHMLITSKK